MYVNPQGYNLYTTDGDVTTPFQLFTGHKPLIAHNQVLSCPIVAKKWTSTSQGHSLTKHIKWGFHGIFIGLPSQQKGFLLFFPHSHIIAVYGYVSFDETFSSAIATTWHCFHSSLLLQPPNSFIPDPDIILEETGTIEGTLLLQVPAMNRGV
jgi:hypothetical protein